MKKAIYIIIFLLVIGLIGGGYVEFITIIKDLRSARAETMSKEFVKNLYSEYHIIGQNCQGEDTNGDSYVSCDVRIQILIATDTQKVLNLSCPTMWKSFTGSTCKERVAIPTGN